MDLNTPLISTVLVCAILLFWVVGAYNRLVALRSAISAAWAQIEEPLKQRHEQLLQLVALLREPLGAESGALDALQAAAMQVHAAGQAVRARPATAGPAATLVIAEQVLATAWTRLSALLGEHAELRASEPVAAALGGFEALDQRLAFRRQLFNQAAHHYNQAVHQFPTNLLTPFFRFDAAGRL